MNIIKPKRNTGVGYVVKDYENIKNPKEKERSGYDLNIKLPGIITENLSQDFDPEDPRYIYEPDLLVEKIITSFTGLKIPVKYPAKSQLYSSDSSFPYHLGSMKSPVRKPPLFHNHLNSAFNSKSPENELGVCESRDDFIPPIEMARY